MRHRPTAALVLTLTLALGIGCRSANPDLSPDVPDAAVRPPEALPDLPSPAVVEENAAADAALDADALEPEPDAEAAPASAAEVQQEAVDLCQSAEGLLARGENDEAVAALDRAYELMLALPSEGDEYLQAREDIRRLVAGLLDQLYRIERSGPAVSMDWDLALPMVDNEHVQREIRSFTTVERDQFIEGYRRSGRYRPMILAQLEEAGLPSQLSWLPLVESWFKVRALSRASAMGLWQFISSTGLRYGLNRDGWIDERFDPEKSTEGAIGYLTDLHGMFGDWPKALAAYNCGEARVERLQRRSDGQFMDFWDLYEMLPQETRRYVPRLFAAIQIIEHPERFGMELPTPDPALEVERVSVARPVQLARLDATLGLSPGTLADLNPELRHKATPSEAYELRVPAGSGPTLTASIDSLPVFKRPVVEYATHRVSSGQTLSVIARRYGTTVSAIMRANNLRSANRIRVGQRLRIPSRLGATRSVSQASFNAADGTHTVRRGDSLHVIASHYGLSVDQLKRQNGLTSDVIQPGQVLKVAEPAAAAASAAGAPEGPGRRYQVTSGDTLGAIADRHGVSLSALLRANKLGRRSTIYPGQWLVIPGG